MADNLQQRREPLNLNAGDTVDFRRNLPKYPANQGWAVQYVAIGGGAEIVWNSTVDADGVSFDINVAAAVTAAYVPGDYELTGYAVNAGNGQRFSFYFNALTVGPNLANLQPGADLTTHAQRMLQYCEATLEQMAQHDLNDTSAEGTEARRKRLQEVTDLRDKYLRERENELQKQAAIARRPSRKKIRANVLVTSPRATGLNQFGAGGEPWNFQ